MRVPGGKERKESEKSTAFAAMVMVKLLEGLWWGSWLWQWYKVGHHGGFDGCYGGYNPRDGIFHSIKGSGEYVCRL